MFKRFNAFLLAAFATLFAAFPALAQTAPDFSGMTSQIDWSPVTAAILLIGGGLAGVYVIVKGVQIILARLGGGR
ncbi:MAG: hypothetical protein FWF12_04050 [Betaproteobacteria bacterium]|nr:hypothetical protein [Betaproteobacteria bacterium]